MIWGSAAGAAVFLGAIAIAPFALIFAVVLAMCAVAWFIKLLREAITVSPAMAKKMMPGAKKQEVERPVQPAHDERFKADFMRKVREAKKAKENGEKPANDRASCNEPRPEDRADWWKRAS